MMFLSENSDEYSMSVQPMNALDNNGAQVFLETMSTYTTGGLEVNKTRVGQYVDQTDNMSTLCAHKYEIR
jgi:hypothetical protein